MRVEYIIHTCLECDWHVFLIPCWWLQVTLYGKQKVPCLLYYTQLQERIMENNTSANVSESSPDSSATLVFIRLPLYTLLPLAKPSGCTTLQACMCLSDTERVSCLFSIKRTKFFWAKCFDVYMQVKSSSQPISDEIFKHLVSESASFRKLSASNDISSTFWPFDMTTEAPKPVWQFPTAFSLDSSLHWLGLCWTLGDFSVLECWLFILWLSGIGCHGTDVVHSHMFCSGLWQGLLLGIDAEFVALSASEKVMSFVFLLGLNIIAAVIRMINLSSLACWCK